uniref:Tetraspanin n=1 Tax=Strigamia maritima TaxID=126957 RepID=T1IXW5_STRMM
MALRGCNVCLKFVVLIFNLLFWLFGVGILAIAIWLRLDYANYVKVHEDLQSYCTGTYILMGAGTTMTLVGFFGCCGAYRESSCMLGTFFSLLLLIFAVEIAAGIWAFVHKDELNKILEDTLLTVVHQEYNVDPAKTEALDLIQKEFECCGSRGYKDWALSKYASTEVLKGSLMNYGPNLPENERPSEFKIPSSCCKPNAKDLCKDKYKVADINSDGIFSEGCAKKLELQLEEKLGLVATIGVLIAVIEGLGMIFSLVLCCALRRERYKI